MSKYDVAVFQEITGLELTEDQLSQYERAERRAYKFLESELGWSFSPVFDYTEYGKTTSECICPSDLSDIVLNNLEKPTQEKGDPLLFPYDRDASHILINPAKSVYKLQLAIPLSGDTQKFVVVKELENVMVKPRNTGFIHYVERCSSWPQSMCGCECPSCAMLVVYADWMTELPESLFDIFTDLIMFYMKHPYSLTENRIVKSESVDGHSVSYGDTDTIEDIVGNSKNPNNLYLSLVKQYIGPYSPYYVKVRI